MIATTILAACTWADPGANPYRGSVPAAVESYADIPADVRARLKSRMERRQYDDLAAIRRDSIEGQHSYTGLRSMHFGGGKLCATVDRSAWKPEHVERGLIYCEAEHCLIVPTVCRNVSRVTRIKREPVAAAEPSEPAGPGIAFAGPLLFDAPGAGPATEAPATVNPAPTFQQAAAPVTAPEPRPWLTAITPPPIQPWAGPVVWAPVPDIPEPGTWALLLAGLGVVAWRARK